MNLLIVLFIVFICYVIYKLFYALKTPVLTDADRRFLKSIREQTNKLSDEDEKDRLLIFLNKRPYDKFHMRALQHITPLFYEVPMTDELEQICKQILEYDMS